MFFMGAVKSGQKVILPPMYMRYGVNHPQAGQYVVDPLVQNVGSYAIVEDASGNIVRTQMSPERFKNSEITGQHNFRVTIPGLPTAGQLTGRVHIYLVYADGQGGMLVLDNPCFSFFIDNTEEVSCACLTEERIRQIIREELPQCPPCAGATEQQIIDVLNRTEVRRNKLVVEPA